MPLFEGCRFAVIVCGGRGLRDPYDKILAGVVVQLAKYMATNVLQGGADGGDAIGALAAERMELPCTRVPVRWQFGTEQTGHAGPARNAKMLSEADLVIALPGGRETLDMIEQARLAGVGVVQLDNNGEVVNG